MTRRSPPSFGGAQAVSFIRAFTDRTTPDADLRSRRFIVGLDFGTTFSSVSVLCIYDHLRDGELHPSQIWSVASYPEAPSAHNDNRTDVPTECWYPSGAPNRDPVSHLPMTFHNPASRNRPSENVAPQDGNRYAWNSDVIEVDDTDPMDMDEQLDEYYWGYEVRKAMRLQGVDATDPRRLRRFKLLLDRSEVTRGLREQLEPVVRRLEDEGVIGALRETDIIADFLERLFRHARDQMVPRHQYNGEPVEFALCIPAIWTRQACRKMQTAMTVALHRTGFITTQYHDVDSLFLVHEPEAASAYVLAHSDNIMVCESFVLLDAGGGTVDAVTYKVASTGPLKLEREAVAPGGALCGSTYLNEAFEKLVRGRLEGETYLFNIERKIDRIMDDFENDTKRNFNSSNLRWRGIFEIDGLRQNADKKFKNNRMVIDWHDMNGVFKSCLEGVSGLMLSQLEEAEQKGVSVTKVILIGGFAASPSLIHHIRQQLKVYSVAKDRSVQLMRPPSFPGTAVASGAVLRALRKEDAPARTTYCSYGLLRDELYDRSNPAHVKQKRLSARDEHDGRPYIRNTIFWFVNKGDTLGPGWECIIPVAYSFSMTEERFLCEEELCVSDGSHESHYTRDHRYNNGWEEAGKIIVDMTELRDKGLVHSVKPAGKTGKEHYLIEFDLVIAMDGLNLRVEARYPRGSTSEESVKQRGRICISTAFLQDTG